VVLNIGQSVSKVLKIKFMKIKYLMHNLRLQSGHSKESTFLTYIGTHQNKDALADLFMQQAGVIW